MRDDEDLQTLHLLAKIGDGLLELAFLRFLDWPLETTKSKRYSQSCEIMVLSSKVFLNIWVIYQGLNDLPIQRFLPSFSFKSNSTHCLSYRILIDEESVTLPPATGLPRQPSLSQSPQRSQL